MMENFQIYLAGGMQGLTLEQQNSWRTRLKFNLQNTRYSSRYKPVVINPVEYYNYESNSHENEREVMNFDLYKLRHSDLVIVSFNAPKSLGTMAEQAVAYDRGIPILGLNKDNYTLHPWQIEMCSRIFTDEDSLEKYVNEYYLN